MSTILSLFPSVPDASTLSSSDLGSELTAILDSRLQAEVALRPSLVVESWEDAYHAGIRVELAGAAFHILTALPLQEPPVSFLLSTRTLLQERLSRLQSDSTPPYTGSTHGRLDAIAEIIAVLDSFLTFHIDSPAL